MLNSLLALYERAILERPLATLLVLAVLIGAAGLGAPRFRLDASSETLVLEGDEALRYYRTVRERYGSDDYLIVTYTPKRDDLFSERVRHDVARLRDALAGLGPVESVLSYLDAPLVESSGLTLSELADGAPTLESPGIDVEGARRELLTSPVYRDLLVSGDATTAALLVQFRPEAGLEPGQLRKDLAEVRRVLDDHRDRAELYLGGVPMIVADSIAFIESDLVTFGAGVSAFLVLLLGVAFRKPRWIVLPLLTCAAAACVMVGVLGWLDWPVTVVSSNFISLLLIMTLSLTVHLIVHYRELHAGDPDAHSRQLVRATLHAKAGPCFYTALTTAVAFSSLVFSDIRPVIDFGWMMVIGLAVGFALAFTLFPSLLVLLPPGEPANRHDLVDGVTHRFATLVQRRPLAVGVAFGALGLASIAGMSWLSVENRFIDYFKESTAIYRGMVQIDTRLGGTTPLDVIVDAPPASPEPEEDDEFEPDWLEDSGGITATSYWVRGSRIAEIDRIHAFLDGLDATGKVLSLSTTLALLDSLDSRALDDDLFLSILYENIPPDISATLVEPYYSEPDDQLRFAVRVFESDPSLRRAELLARIERGLIGDLGIPAAQVHLTGMLVLYNNVLQSLFRSQILSVGVVFLAIFAMFVLVFRSLRIAVLAIVPNLVGGALVLGTMGWLGIPLDLMTITIAAISIGIGVDDTIHYVHRFVREFRKDGDYAASIERSHGSIGRAMYYTSVTIALGFSILALSNFVPTVYFGLLTGLAMLAALLADLTLLPLLLARFEALGDAEA